MGRSKKIYLDYNATTPVDPEVMDAMLPYFTEKFGNPSSVGHLYGWEAEEAVERAREQVAALIGASSGELYFTSGATEAVNLALRGICAGPGNGWQIVTCATEHKAVLETCESLEQQGYRVTCLPVDRSGTVDPVSVEEAISDQTVLVCLMHANNEIGTIHSLREISRLTRKRGIPLITDATQSVGKIPVDVAELGVDLLACSSHKLYGPKGAGALYVAGKYRKQLTPLLTGGGQENGVRPGTLNVPAIVGFGKACELCGRNMERDTGRLEPLRRYLETELEELEETSVNGAPGNRLPYMSSLTFSGIEGGYLVRQLNNLAVSRGSACRSATHRPSHVLKAIGHSDEDALATLRIGLGRFTTREEVEQAVRDIHEAVPRLKALSQ